MVSGDIQMRQYSCSQYGRAFWQYLDAAVQLVIHITVEPTVQPRRCGAPAPSRPWPLPKSATILFYPQLVSSILVFVVPVTHPFGRRPPFVFLVFLLTLCCGISR